MQILILGDGHLGRAVAATAMARGHQARLLGRPSGGRHIDSAFRAADLVVEASRADAVVDNIAAALECGARRFVVATTGWSGRRDEVDAALRSSDAAAVVGANFSIGVALFSRLVEAATDLFGSIDDFDPYLVEWHRRAKADRPSGTALELARRIAARHPRLAGPTELETASVRAGSSPGMHLVGFDADGETVELRITARDRSAYAAGILVSADWLRRAPRTPGIHEFDLVVDELLARRTAAAA
jgi:4-hydroxy-tetrahydrodipicolinate reductase